jgi:shikimate kinase
MTPRVVLIGMPGTGKTTTGRRLAAVLQLPFADSDELVADELGRPVPEYLASEGEEAFRRHEQAAVRAALAGFDGVLALGGGAVTIAPVRVELAAAGVPVVWLRGSLRTLAQRVGDGRSRPLLADDPQARLAALAARREPLFRECATLTVQTDNRTPAQVADKIAEMLQHEPTGENA